MSTAGPERRPAFWWQGLLILLPVVVLAAVGLSALRSDRAVAKQEAVERAQTVADALLPRLLAALVPTNAPADTLPCGFEVDAAGKLVDPPAFSDAETPAPLKVAELDTNQTRLWCAAQRAESGQEDPQLALQGYDDFIASRPPASFAAVAQYARAVLLERRSDGEAAAEAFGKVIVDYPKARAESGVPLAPLARLKQLELRLAPGSTGQRVGHETLEGKATLMAIEEVCSNAVWEPNALSPAILARAAELAAGSGQAASNSVSRWQQVWRNHERSRALYAGWNRGRRAVQAEARAQWFATAEPMETERPDWQPASAEGMTNASLILAIPRADRSWLALREGEGSNAWYSCRSESEIGAQLTELVQSASHVPEYFGIGLDVAGKRLTWPAPDLRMWENRFYSGRTGGKEKIILNEPATEVLATAESELRAGSTGAKGAVPRLLKVSVYLTSPAELFARQQAHVFWFTALIGCAALAAGVGFLAAYRAFHRQLRLSELKSNFVSSVSHELRAPIASVRLMAESLDRGTVSDPPKQREYFKFIVQECRRLSSLIENVLDFSRIEQGRKAYEFEPTDVAALTRQTVKLMQPYATERRVELGFQEPQPGTGDLQVSMDGKAVQQALVNLIDNAIKHSPNGGCVLVGLGNTGKTGAAGGELANGWVAETEAVGAQTNGASFLRIWVEDRGEGIPREEQQKIFERFYRLGSELRRETQGVGIGLSIVKHIAEAHGGRVLVNSEVGRGSTFTLELPLREHSGQTGPAKGISQ